MTLEVCRMSKEYLSKVHTHQGFSECTVIDTEEVRQLIEELKKGE